MSDKLDRVQIKQSNVLIFTIFISFHVKKVEQIKENIYTCIVIACMSNMSNFTLAKI